ncbi:MAG: Proline-tRNA ligase [candidate division TM6 bacterium GW2011_GWF2_30_66]|jgi:prolyl-tRNA synthetase|nr:MAG: Proline-tRNA ligase [candidate division TM6 bacterium GW2011_GWF2_30_66]
MSDKKLADIQKDFSQWYQDIVYEAELVDQAPVRGCFVIRPYGTEIWDNIKSVLDKRIKETGHENALFPLLIPLSFINKEAQHVEGFAPELAIVTKAGGKDLEEPLVVRPTSETMIHFMFAKWIKSWRDLPLKINHWANVVRWEMRPRAFIRTTEFFWQEGHTAHATKEQALEEVLLMLQEYVNLAQDYLAIPVIKGRKSEKEKFPGAEKTYTFEALMQDGKAVQMGTSHLLSQSFAKSFEMQYQDKEGKLAYPFLTSWGATTRLVGALIMSHGDQKGLVLPPKIAPIQVVIIPILKKNADNSAVMDMANLVKSKLEGFARVKIDSDETKSPGAKFFKWELKGVPVRMEIGSRDVESKSVVVADRLGMAKESVYIDNIENYIRELLENIQNTMFERAKERLAAQWHKKEKLADFGPEMQEIGGFYQTGWCQDPECEKELKKYQASTRCVLEEKTFKKCFNCDKDSVSDVLVAKSY